MHDEELRAVSVRPSVGHCHRAGLIATLINRRSGVDLIVKFSAPGRCPTASSARGIATLDHESFDYAMKDDAIVITAFSQRNKILRSFWRVCFKEFETNSSLVGLNYRRTICHRFSSVFLIL